MFSSEDIPSDSKEAGTVLLDGSYVVSVSLAMSIRIHLCDKCNQLAVF